MAVHAFDIVVLGEILLEVTTDKPIGHGVAAELGVSGDALNVAAAAAAVGADVALLGIVADDELGRAVTARVGALGISTDLITVGHGDQGVYFSHSDPAGEREFTYVRSGSVGSTLSADHVDREVFSAAGAVVASGITGAISPSARTAVHAASRSTDRFVFDPNYRPRLTSAEAARRLILELAPRCALMTPSHPMDTSVLGAADAMSAATLIRELGTRAVAVTCGSSGVQVLDDDATWIDSVPAPAVVDQTGAGDCFVGSTVARIVRGDRLVDAVAFGAAAASLAVGGRGGTGSVPDAHQVMAHAARSVQRA